MLDDSFTQNSKLKSMLSGFNLNFEKKSNISGKSGVSGGLKSKRSGFAGFGGKEDTNELTEMMDL